MFSFTLASFMCAASLVPDRMTTRANMFTTLVSAVSTVACLADGRCVLPILANLATTVLWYPPAACSDIKSSVAAWQRCGTGSRGVGRGHRHAEM